MKNIIGIGLLAVAGYVLYEMFYGPNATTTNPITGTVTQSGQTPTVSQTAQTTNVPVTSVAPSGAVNAANTAPVTSVTSGSSPIGLGPNVQLIANMTALMYQTVGRNQGNPDEWDWVLKNLGFTSIPSPDALGYLVVNGVRTGGQMSAGQYISAIDYYVSQGNSAVPGIAGLPGLGRAYTSGMGAIGAGYTQLNGGGGRVITPSNRYPFSNGKSNFGDMYRYGYHNPQPAMLNMNPDASKYELATKFIN